MQLHRPLLPRLTARICQMRESPIQYLMARPGTCGLGVHIAIAVAGGDHIRPHAPASTGHAGGWSLRSKLIASMGRIFAEGNGRRKPSRSPAAGRRRPAGIRVHRCLTIPSLGAHGTRLDCNLDSNLRTPRGDPVAQPAASRRCSRRASSRSPCSDPLVVRPHAPRSR